MSTTIAFNTLKWINKRCHEVDADLNHLKPLNDVFRHANMDHYDPRSNQNVIEFDTGFLDLLNVHNICIHSSTLGHYSSIGVRGENTIIKKVTVSSSFGYLIMDSVVAPHDQTDVSRQLIKHLHFTIKNVHGNVIDLRGSPTSFSLIFVTMD